MEQDGVEVRPIKMLSGDHDFNETFFTDARTDKDNVIGQVNGGWAVAMTLLGYERGESAATRAIRHVKRGVKPARVPRERRARRHRKWRNGFSGKLFASDSSHFAKRLKSRRT